MSGTVSAQLSKPSFSPLRLQERTLVLQIAAVVLGTAFLAASSYITVPMYPVPVTMQTFAVTLIGALYGWRLGAVTVAAWLFEAAVGFPVLAEGKVGLAAFVGPTAGYLAAFPVAAALTGWLAERGWNGRRPWLAFAAALAANALCLAIGATWLATLIGAEKAIAAGVLPFIVGGVLKAGLSATTLAGLNRVQAGNRRV
ncbi:biotin transport system substrate-specific component [Pseudochelatococcus lubricantis]|uniref:Biotin transporter n=1 Tax=Pseudochelatococcus lubricantis TaxID=1538102 RepID=A0ABX0UYH9_9HYPH|nr:biotin transporter BioY [Pseudochelatococcus lubricantis]NIJ56650.1 biotin transport system substrate-specific component [Pseudochelatococcus lubricantis]